MIPNTSKPTMVAVLVTVALLSLPRAAGAAEIVVGQTESIAAALQRANAGDTIRLTGKEYRENIVIDVPVKVVGAVDDGMPVIHGGYVGNVVHITAPGTELSGVHISEAGSHLTKDMACILIEADGVTVRDNVVTESLHGIYVKGGNDTRIIGNRIEGRLDLIQADRGNGIHLWKSTDNLIEENEIMNTRDGIYFSFAHSTTVRRNHIHNVRYGLHYMYSNGNRFEDNLFEENVAGAALMYSENISFERNTFARCRGFRAYGVLFQSMDDVTAQSNLILDNSRGIFMNNTDGCAFEHNDLVDNDLAIQLNGGCDGNYFAANNFINNVNDLLLDVSDRETRWRNGQGGNHWSGYDGYDLDGDGIGDVAYGIQNAFQVIAGKVPEVRFYLMSPAAELLGAAEKALPILRLGDAEDPLPLMRAAENPEVPWATAGSMARDPSYFWAGLFFVGAFVPAITLLRFARVRRRGGHS